MTDMFKMLKDRAGGLASRFKGRKAGATASDHSPAGTDTPGAADDAKNLGSEPPDDPQTLKSRHDT